MRLDERDEFPQIVHRERPVHDQKLRRAGDVEDRNDVVQRIERQRAVEKWRDDDVSAGDEEQRIAVGGRFRHVLDREIASRARLVLDHDLRPELDRKAFGGHAREGVGDAAGGGARHEANRPRGIPGGLREGGAENERADEKHGEPDGANRFLFHCAGKGLIFL